MAHLVNGLAEYLQDLLILAIAAAVFGAAGAVISFVAHHAWFRFWPVRADADNQLSDTVQTSLLAFSRIHSRVIRHQRLRQPGKG